MAKPPIGKVLFIIAFLTTAVAAANFYVNLTSERGRRIRAEEQLDAVTRAKEALEQERDELTQAKSALEEQVAQISKKAQDVADQFAQEKRAREALTAELAQVRKESSQVKGQLETERKDRQALADDLTKAKQSYTALSNELTTLRQAKEALEKRVKEMLAARAKEAEQIVVTPPRAGGGVTPGKGEAARPSTSSGRTESAAVRGEPVEPRTVGTASQAKVLVVNREYRFVVLNVGSKDGVRKGSRFSIWRDNKQVATAEVDKLYDNMVAANLLEEAKKADVREGDLARLIS